MTRILYTSDLHGREPLYQEMAATVRRHHADIVLLGGDLLPRIGHGAAALEAQKTFCSRFLHPFFRSFRQDSQVRIYAIPGNDDYFAALPLFEIMESEGLLTMIQDKNVPLTGDFRLAGYACVPPTPFRSKDFEKKDLTEDDLPEPADRMTVTWDGSVRPATVQSVFGKRPSIADDLNTLFKPETAKNTFFLIHGPPYHTALDMIHTGVHVGSRALRAWILRVRPRMTLHGHIHESPRVSGRFADMLGDTLCVNTGQTESGLSAVIFEPDDPAGTLYHTIYGNPGLTDRKAASP